MKLSRILGMILFISAVNCFIWPVNALNLDYYGIESWIQPDMSVKNIITITTNSSAPNIDYNLRYRVYDVVVESEYAPADCETEITDTSMISCTFHDHEKYDKTKIKIHFDTKELTEAMDEDYSFDHFVPIEDNVKSFFNTVYLPESAALATDDSFSPTDGKTLSDGRHIMIYWDKDNIGEDVFFTVTYKLPAGNSALDIGIMVIIAVVIIVSSGIIYMKTTQKHRSINVIMPLLKGDEKVIVNILSKHEGSINQRVIVRESDFSKAKVSRLVAGLKERGIIEVEILGRTNKVTLKVKR